jgi:predicted ferric reductase
MLYSATKTSILKVLYLVFLLTAITTVILSNQINSFDLVNTYLIGQILGVLGISCLSMQFFLSSRFKFLERAVGLEKIMAWHQANGKLATYFLCLHPVLIFWDQIFIGDSIVSSFIDIWYTLTPFHVLGEIALILVLFTVLVTIFSRRLKLNYEHWKIIHKVAYVIIILGFIHSFFVGSNLAPPQPTFYWWVALLTLVTISVLHRYVFRRIYHYEVVRIQPETGTVRSIYMKPVTEADRFSYDPGQFAFIRFFSPDLSSEEHHFTLSSAPGEENISISVKELGDYTSTLGKLAVGAKATIQGPYGVFSNRGYSGPTVFIAGGIGITPVMSMIRNLVKTNPAKPTTLIYANKNLADIAFHQELNEITEKNSWLKVVHVLSDEEHPDFYHGYISKEILEKEVPELNQATIFLVGPPPMMAAVEKVLVELNVNKDNVFTERFALR